MERALPWGAPNSWWSLMSAGDKYTFHWCMVFFNRITAMSFPFGEKNYWDRWMKGGDFEPWVLMWHSLSHLVIGFCLALCLRWHFQGPLNLGFAVGLFAFGKETEDVGEPLKKAVDISSFIFGGVLCGFVF